MNDTFRYYQSSMTSHGSLQNVMGTRFDIVITGKDKTVSEPVWQEIITELNRLDKMMNRFDPGSEIATVNAHAFQYPVAVSGELWEILCDCEIYHKKTAGLFDITLKDFSKVTFTGNDRSISFLSNDISFDLGAYAKGYALRKIHVILKDANVEQAFVDFGNSSILAVGHHPYGNSWKVSIENPYENGEILDEIDLTDTSLSTSGNVPSYSKHIVRPDSGIYNDERKLVCVRAKNPVEAEVLSTTIMIATLEEREEILNRFDADNIRVYNSL